jgi:hypothetical protein
MQQVFELMNAYGHRLKERGYRIGLRLFYTDLVWAIDLALTRGVSFVLANREAWESAISILQTRIGELASDPTEMTLPSREEEWPDMEETAAANIVMGIVDIFWDHHEREANDWHPMGVAKITTGEVFDIIENTLSTLARTRSGDPYNRWLAKRYERPYGSRTKVYYRLWPWVFLAVRELRRVTLNLGAQRGVDRIPTVGDGSGPWSDSYNR